ncbi:MAG: 4-alpha-glucanotransferase [Aquamicrobium sp.]|nr:4-alpha-glucanotransferase [Aquamicrobium sp.]
MKPSVQHRATRQGIHTSYEGPDGRQIDVPLATIERFLSILKDGAVQPPPLPQPGATAPAESCYFPSWLCETKAWGIALQLYELRSRRDWGIGDFSDLASFCRVAAASGADFVGVNPLHALFIAEPQRCSPFSPSNRLFLNPLYIAVDQVLGYDHEMVDATRLNNLRSSDLVDYQGVADLKLDVLRRIWDGHGPGDNAELAEFRAAGGAMLERHALFEALSLHLQEQGYGSGWTAWPEEFRRFDAPSVGRFAVGHANRVTFQIWLQWVARRQLEDAAKAALEAGMRIGLYLDFAVGEAPDGSATWSEPELVVSGIHIGAPPDMFSAGGQDWGLAPISPRGLAANDFAPYRRLMAGNMVSAGALRIDHAMSLRQLFWIPEGHPPREGGFVTYPIDGLLSVLATVSRENATIIIGEDLGHVPPGFRDQMADATVLSYRILYFEQRKGRFVSPLNWPSLALACISTHDLPTLEGWWAGDDIVTRHEHDLITAVEARRQHRRRRSERRVLLDALRGGGMLSRRTARLHALEAGRPGMDIVVAAHRFIARTPCRLACMRLADAVGERHPTNLPGVGLGYPNWRRRLSVLLDELEAGPLFNAITAGLRRERPR